MSAPDPLRAARSFYAPRVEAYRTSASHADADDLARMVALVAPAPGARALDVATGGGNAARALARAGCRVVAFDATRGFLEALRGECSGVEGDAARLPFSDGAFDVVACRIAAHHFADLDAFLAEAARVLAPGGVLYAFDLASPQDERAAAVIDRVERLRDPSHVRSRTLAEWRDGIAQAGLVPTFLRRGRSELDLDAWLARAGPGAAAEAEVRRLLAEHRAETLGGYGLVAPGRLAVLRVEALARKLAHGSLQSRT